jgi:hypothetical protein
VLRYAEVRVGRYEAPAEVAGPDQD